MASVEIESIVCVLSPGDISLYEGEMKVRPQGRARTVYVICIGDQRLTLGTCRTAATMATAVTAAMIATINELGHDNHYTFDKGNGVVRCHLNRGSLCLPLSCGRAKCSLI